ncbi:MAG: cupin domain-containing protein [Synechococcaceae cyanobacterium]|jgi:predicted cupin superfamily sugar epimerase
MPVTPEPPAQELIARFALQPHPEGGWYREWHRSPLNVTRADGGVRSGLTTILFLLEARQISRWHRVQGADEAWQFLDGSALELFCLPPEGGAPLRRVLNAPLRDQAAEPMAVAPAGWWQAARSLGAWSLVSCAVGPGFDFDDFSLLRDLPVECHPQGATATLL